jgi:hypothetical protein
MIKHGHDEDLFNSRPLRLILFPQIGAPLLVGKCIFVRQQLADLLHNDPNELFVLIGCLHYQADLFRSLVLIRWELILSVIDFALLSLLHQG